jgi:long-chain fatty acid transport protein
VTAGGISLAVDAAHGGGFGVREQSAYFLGSAFAGSAAGTDISSMFWNSAATASKKGCNSSSNLTAVFGRAEETAQAGLFVTAAPGAPTSADVGSSAVVPSSYSTCQLTDNLYAGLGMNAPFGLATKPDNPGWAGSPIAITSKIFSFDINPTLAYKLTSELTIGVGLQIEYLSLRLTHGSFGPSPSRSYDALDWGFGATAGVLWQPSRAASIGLGYRSAVNAEVSGTYLHGPISTNATSKITLPDEVTLSARQSLTRSWRWARSAAKLSRVQNVTAVGSGCGAGSVCETTNSPTGRMVLLGWVEYAYNRSPLLRRVLDTKHRRSKTLRDILLPDSSRIHFNVGASYKISDRHSRCRLFALVLQDAPFALQVLQATREAPTATATPPAAVLLNGKNRISRLIFLAFGLKYRFNLTNCGAVTPT